jgi:branched-chain amino acid transport system permease protein
MAFFLEALLGGLMAGMLYALVALGFVLIFKASGVFNFAQGAMVLFAALAMARFAEWVPGILGLDNKILSNIIAFGLAAALMFLLAWLIERLVLRHLVNQEGVTLLMATLGITYFLDGLGQTIFGSDIYKIDVGMPKDPVFLLDSVFPGGVLVNLEDVYAACIAALGDANALRWARGLPAAGATGAAPLADAVLLEAAAAAVASAAVFGVAELAGREN